VLRGFLYVWAVAPGGNQIRWNHLSGGGTVVNYENSSAWSYNAAAFRATADVPLGQPTGDPGVLNLDGIEFSSPFGQLTFDFQAVSSAGLSGSVLVVADPSLVLQPVDIDLRKLSTGPVTTTASFDIWNMNEFMFSGTRRCVTCWDHTRLADYDLPVHFLLQNLQTDIGRARVDGRAITVCDVDADPNDGLPLGADPFDVVSRDAALVGLSVRRNDIDFSAVAFDGTHLVGLGAESARVEFDMPDPAPARGACCFADGSCDEKLSEPACIALGGTFAGSGCATAGCKADCPGNVDGDREVGFGDLVAVFASWGPCDECPEDLDADGEVGFGDAILVLGGWGMCP